ncbi:MAG: MATE family efflux transporter [Leptospirales bacterium]|nr:MATE family efflux transporter [Leptospirales bacterium]
MSSRITHASIFKEAWPIILASASTPLLGFVDVAVIGRTGDAVALGAIALGALLFAFLFWGFGFLRMGVTGFVAQAHGAGRHAELRAAVFRALLLALFFGIVLLAMQLAIGAIAFRLFHASSGVEAVALRYFQMRIWSAPAALGGFVVMGVFIALGRSALVLLVQLSLNVINALLDIYFAGLLQQGAAGVALGTAIAEWTAFLLGLVLLWRLLKRIDAAPFWPLDWKAILEKRALLRTLSANGDIMLRTLALIGGFAWFADRSAAAGDAVLAANHLLLQFLGFSAFFLDGFAYVAEAHVGAAIGAGDRLRFQLAVQRSSELAAASAALLAAGIFFGGDSIIAWLSANGEIRRVAGASLPLAALYVLLAFAAFQLDGIFIGSSRTRQMRNASLASVSLFILLSLWSLPHYGNRGLWAAFIGYVLLRAATLLFYYPAVWRLLQSPAGRER